MTAIRYEKRVFDFAAGEDGGWMAWGECSEAEYLHYDGRRADVQVRKVDAPAVAGKREALTVTDEMVTAYLTANDAYWQRTDELPTPPDRWRAGNVQDATRESLRAALSVSPPGPEIQPHLDHQVGAPVTPLPLESAGGAPSATAEPRE